MTSKHTPGPWVIREEPERTFKDGTVDHGGFRVDGPNVEQLAFVWNASHRWGPDPQPFGASEARANARVIRAAPDLLDALRNARAFMASVMEERGDHGVSVLIADADRAIAKAEGEAP